MMLRCPHYPEYQRPSFQRIYSLWRPSEEISSRMCQSSHYRKNQRWRANITILMSSRLYQYTLLLLTNSPETSKCNWNEFLSKEIFYMIPKRITVITKLLIMVMLLQWSRSKYIEVIDISLCYDLIKHSIADSFVKAFMTFLSSVFNDGNYNINFELNPRSWIVVMVTFLCVEYALNRIAICRQRVIWNLGLWYSGYFIIEDGAVL